MYLEENATPRKQSRTVLQSGQVCKNMKSKTKTKSKLLKCNVYNFFPQINVLDCKRMETGSTVT